MILIYKSSHTFLYQVLVLTGIHPYSDIFHPLDDTVFPTVHSPKHQMQVIVYHVGETRQARLFCHVQNNTSGQ